MKLAEMKAKQIEFDILAGHFDEMLARYKLQTMLSVVAPDITPKITPTLKEVWEKYLDPTPILSCDRGLSGLS